MLSQTRQIILDKHRNWSFSCYTVFIRFQKPFAKVMMHGRGTNISVIQQRVNTRR